MMKIYLYLLNNPMICVFVSYTFSYNRYNNSVYINPYCMIYIYIYICSVYNVYSIYCYLKHYDIFCRYRRLMWAHRFVYVYTDWVYIFACTQSG